MPTYPVTSKENSRRIRVAIRHVFLSVWDPIGIADEPMAQDEYDSYIGRMFELLFAGADDYQLVSYLNWVTGERMELGTKSMSELQPVISALRAIDLHDPEQGQSTDLA
jgi:hypothetical protein